MTLTFTKRGHGGYFSLSEGAVLIIRSSICYGIPVWRIWTKIKREFRVRSQVSPPTSSRWKTKSERAASAANQLVIACQSALSSQL